MSTCDSEQIVSSLSYQDKERILANIIWEFFGEFTSDGTPTLNPFKKQDRDDIKGAIKGMRREFFPSAKRPKPSS